MFFSSVSIITVHRSTGNNYNASILSLRDNHKSAGCTTVKPGKYDCSAILGLKITQYSC